MSAASGKRRGGEVRGPPPSRNGGGGGLLVTPGPAGRGEVRGGGGGEMRGSPPSRDGGAGWLVGGSRPCRLETAGVVVSGDGWSRDSGTEGGGARPPPSRNGGGEGELVGVGDSRPRRLEEAGGGRW